MTDKIVVLNTCATFEDAERLARALVSQHLAACVNVVSQVQSFYRWKGELETAAEFLLIIKTSQGLFDALQAEVAKLHTYAVPELIALPVMAGSENYLTWLSRNLRGGETGGGESGGVEPGGEVE